MKKKILLILIIFITPLFITGCDGNITRDLRHDGFSITNASFTCSDLTEKDKEGNLSKEIQYLDNNFAYTKDGNFYEISLGQKYSNDENCKKIDFTNQVTATFDSSIIRSSNSKLYYTPSQTSATAYTEVTPNDNSYQIYSLLLNDATITKVITIDSGTGLYYVLKTDGNVYSYTITRPDYNSSYTITDTKVIYSKEAYKGNIIDFNYDKSSKSKNYLITDNNYYRMKATNQKECSKYADVECNYKLQEDTVLNENKNRLLYFGSSMLITDYLKIFTLS